MAKDLSSIEDVDMAEAMSNLAKESNLLEAAQASYGRVTRMSLFDYL